MKMPNFSALQAYLKTATLAAINGGKILKKYWKNVKQIEDKSTAGDLVTEADKESEKIILQLIKEKYPSHSILAEESTKMPLPCADFLWVVDPLDGTVNYAHQNPLFAISIALLYQNEVIAGVVFNPLYHELFQAAKGIGATLNGERITVSPTKTLDKSLLSTGFAYDRRTTDDTNYPEFCHLSNLTHGVRRFGAASLDLAFVAAGRFDGYWERGLKPWDMAAGALLVQEAGGKVSAYDETPLDLQTGKILATNGKLHHALSQELLNVSSQKA
ncbi:inositol monophosphatase family protein [Parachlamydia sp. AcF125]|uniref:inositol monophosphatase family protein n=1 Tax=Parachlamydia sp. AcF125 TaxID=2795736 RepID=UPI001BC92339|nr:inositol monophosphatase family protein [Parachlamydia sp. AcF125]MBS4167778.1 Inositol-1-monophosphatase [Parachlamydia sp. AcF125]